ncbi:outer membrane family protein [Helicobacter sp. 13S00477-4]|uniref:outer membrane family protein n=1 Tax=Helicobacter sp. 13S00477-4 TaxID=1905759 RepID=UPI002151A332|nr:outer membrane family protein [Helicobacter sp. 13S00477-4]
MEKINVAKKYKYLIASMLLMSSLYGFDYKVSGSAINFSKFGFNDSRIDPQKGQYPTETFVNLTGTLQVDADLGAGFSAGIGGAIGGQAYDSTKFAKYTDGSLATPHGLGFEYMGEWNGWFPKDYYPPATSRNAKKYVIYNAYIDYKYADIFHIIVGRYKSDMDWFYEYTEGAKATLKLSDFTFYAFTSWGRGIADGQWLYNFYREKYYGVHALGVSYNHKNLTIEPNVWFSPETFTAPSLKLIYDTNPNFQGSGFRSKTTFIGMYVYQANNDKWGRYAPARYNTWDPYLDGGKWKYLQGPGGGTILVKQRFDLNNYNFGGGLYINIGNPNPNIGTYGNPIGIEQWTDSIYNIGFAGINNITAADAITVFLKGGASYGQFSWNMVGRVTTAPRANEQSLALYLDYQFTKHIQAGLKLEYFNSTTKTGYNPGSGLLAENGIPINIDGNPNFGISKNISQDRSHLMTHITYSF